MKPFSKLCALILALALLCAAPMTASAIDSYVSLYGFDFYINQNGEAVIHDYDDRSALVSLPASLLVAPVKEIEGYAFSGDTVITGVDFGSAALRHIGDSAFSDCSGLTSVDLPDGIETLGFGAFQRCAVLAAIDFGETITAIPAQCCFRCASLSDITLPDTVTSIGDRAFAGCTSLKRVDLSDNVTSISGNAFDGCPGLVIYASSGSYAYLYAILNDIDVIATDGTYIFGDANLDGKVSVSDVTAIQRHLAEFDTLYGASRLTADADQDGTVDIRDATLIQTVLAEYDVTSVVGELLIL